MSCFLVTSLCRQEPIVAATKGQCFGIRLTNKQKAAAIADIFLSASAAIIAVCMILSAKGIIGSFGSMSGAYILMIASGGLVVIDLFVWLIVRIIHQKNDLSLELKEARDDIKRLKDVAQQEKEKSLEIQSISNDFQQFIQSEKKKFEVTQHSIEKLNQSSEQVQKNLEQVHIQIENANTSSQMAEQDVNKLRKSSVQAQKNLDEVHTQIENTKTYNQKLLKEMSELNNEFGKDIKESKAYMAQARADIEIIKNAVKEKMDTADQDILLTEQKVQHLNSKYDNYNKAIENADKKLKEWNADVFNRSFEINIIDEKLKSVNEKFNKAHSAIENLESHTKELIQQAQTIEGGLDNQQKQLLLSDNLSIKTLEQAKQIRNLMNSISKIPAVSEDNSMVKMPPLMDLNDEKILAAENQMATLNSLKQLQERIEKLEISVNGFAEKSTEEVKKMIRFLSEAPEGYDN